MIETFIGTILYVKQGPAVSTFIESRDNSEFSFK